MGQQGLFGNQAQLALSLWPSCWGCKALNFLLPSASSCPEQECLPALNGGLRPLPQGLQKPSGIQNQVLGQKALQTGSPSLWTCALGWCALGTHATQA